jgi:hypothetical protein
LSSTARADGTVPQERWALLVSAFADWSGLVAHGQEAKALDAPFRIFLAVEVAAASSGLADRV